ncbi:MAG: hypothetical protein ACKVS9_17220 [Phycisphaerae bacterium]
MAEHSNRFYVRCDPTFFTIIDDWRRNQSPIPSRARAIRELAMRGASADKYLATILKQTNDRLAQAGLMEAGQSDDWYRRLQAWIVENLDFAARIDSLPPAQGLEALREDAQAHGEPQETPASSRSERETRRRSR